MKYETEELKTKLNQIEISEKRRVEKEKFREERILIRDLFLMAHKKLHEEINKRALPKNVLSIVYESDIIELSNKYIFFCSNFSMIYRWNFTLVKKNDSNTFNKRKKQMMIFI
jgi:hypothetical protein